MTRRRGWFVGYRVGTANLCTWVKPRARTFKRHIVEHKQAAKNFYKENGVAVHADTHDHHINWEEAN